MLASIMHAYMYSAGVEGRVLGAVGPRATCKQAIHASAVCNTDRYEKARKSRDYGFEREFERELAIFVSDCDKRIAVGGGGMPKGRAGTHTPQQQAKARKYWFLIRCAHNAYMHVHSTRLSCVLPLVFVAIQLLYTHQHVHTSAKRTGSGTATTARPPP
jgi:hypothetical protein